MVSSEQCEEGGGNEESNGVRNERHCEDGEMRMRVSRGRCEECEEDGNG